MITQPDPALVRLNKSFSRAASLMAVFVGGTVLLGWIFDITTLKSFLPELADMKANTALAFIAAGVALWFSTKDPFTSRARYTVQSLGFTIALLGVLTLCEYIFHWQFGIDELLFKDPIGGIKNLVPGRMAPLTALNFMLTGSALLFLQRETAVGFRTAQFISLLVALFSLLALLGYAFGETSLYGIGAYNQIAFHTAATFMITSGGLL